MRCQVLQPRELRATSDKAPMRWMRSVARVATRPKRAAAQSSTEIRHETVWPRRELADWEFRGTDARQPWTDSSPGPRELFYHRRRANYGRRRTSGREGGSDGDPRDVSEE